MALTFKYGDLDLNPKPLLTIAKEYIKTAANSGLATTYAITLDGHILPDTGVVPPDNHGGLNKVFSGINELKDAFNNDFELLLLHCSGDDPIISGYPKITSFNINNATDNYVQRADYSITLELPSLTGSGFDSVGPTGHGDLSSFGIISYSDDFSVEFLEERIGGTGGGFGEMASVFSISRNISAQGAALGPAGSDYKEPWERAQDFLTPKLGIQPEMTTLSGLLCPHSNVVNNVRSISVNKSDGSVSVTEAYIALPAGAQAYEDFEATVDTSADEALVSVSINGTVQGVANIDYSGCPASGVDNLSKLSQAKAYYVDTVVPAIYSRATAATGGVTISGCHSDANLHIDPLSSSLGYNTVAGTLTYTYSYNNRAVNCVAGACVENINITENEPNDIFSSLTVLGRVSGPVMQAIGTVGPRTREIAIEAVFPPAAACDTSSSAGSYFVAPTGYDLFVKSYELALSGSYNQVFLNSFSKTWDPKAGRYTMNKSWTVGDC